jgi:regulator of replication initiation timing
MQQQKQQSAPLPPLPPPNKNAGQLYGIPLHPLIMFQTHDNKLNEHDLSIAECFDQLKEFEGRLIVVEGNGGGVHPATATATATVIAEAVPAGVSDLNELMNDGVFINGVVDNIMSTTNFASIVENIIPLKEENEMLKQRISEQEIRSDQMQQFIQHLEERLRNIENELAQPYEETLTPAPAPVIRVEEVAAASATESEVVDGSRDDETVETASIAEIVAESINDIILSSSTLSSSTLSSSTLSSSITSSTHM